jgi:hypothetical protein
LLEVRQGAMPRRVRIIRTAVSVLPSSRATSVSGNGCGNDKAPRFCPPRPCCSSCFSGAVVFTSPGISPDTMRAVMSVPAAGRASREIPPASERQGGHLLENDNTLNNARVSPARVSSRALLPPVHGSPVAPCGQIRVYQCRGCSPGKSCCTGQLRKQQHPEFPQGVAGPCFIGTDTRPGISPGTIAGRP